MDTVKYFLLAGGRGARMRPLTDQVPKPLIRFGPHGRILDFNLYNVLSAGGGDVDIITQHFSQLIELYVEANWRSAFSAKDMKLKILPSSKVAGRDYLGTADALYQCLIVSEPMPDISVVLPADQAGVIDLKPLIDFHLRSPAPATAAVTSADPLQRRPSSSLIKPEPRLFPEGWKAKKDSKWEALGIYVFNTRRLLSLLELNQRESSYELEEDIIPRLVKSGELRYFPILGPGGSRIFHRDIDDFYTYWLAHIELLSGRLEELSFDLEKGARPPVSRFNLVRKYESGSKRIYNSMVADIDGIEAATVIDSVIGPGARVQEGAEVRQSVVMEGAVVKENARVHSMLVEPHREVPAQEVREVKETGEKKFMKVSRGIHQMIPPFRGKRFERLSLTNHNS